MGIDLAKLKELAELATPGRNFDRLPSAGGGLKYTCTGDDDSLVLRVDHKNGEFGFIGPKGEEDEAFFLACTPQAVIELIAEVERLRTRLEIDERTPYDGIACRDETIKGLDKKCDRLKRQVDMLINQHMPREPIPDMPGWTRVIDADRLKAENEALRQFAAEAYQVLGVLDAPENVLDNASDAANGVPLRHETLLPFFAEDYEALRKDAARYRWLIASAWYVGPEPKGDTEAVSWHDHNGTMHGVTAAIDAALEGGGR